MHGALACRARTLFVRSIYWKKIHIYWNSGLMRFVIRTHESRVDAPPPRGHPFECIQLSQRADAEEGYCHGGTVGERDVIWYILHPTNSNYHHHSTVCTLLVVAAGIHTGGVGWRNNKQRANNIVIQKVSKIIDRQKSGCTSSLCICFKRSYRESPYPPIFFQD